MASMTMSLDNAKSVKVFEGKLQRLTWCIVAITNSKSIPIAQRILRRVDDSVLAFYGKTAPANRYNRTDRPFVWVNKATNKEPVS